MLVEISQEEYKKLLRIKLNYDILLRGVIGASDLTAYEDRLVFMDEELDRILNLLEPDSYQDRIKVLRMKYNQKEE